MPNTYRITYSITCQEIYYVDIDAENKDEALEKFNAGYYDYDDKINTSCSEPEIDDIQCVQ